MNPENTVVETRALEALGAHPERTRALLIAEGAAGIPAAIRVAEMLTSAWRPLVLLGSDSPFPFRTRPSVIIVPGMPPGVIACAPMLEARGIASRLTTQADFPGCFDGSLAQLADLWLGSLSSEEVREVQVAGWGSATTLGELEALASRYGVLCHFSRS